MKSVKALRHDSLWKRRQKVPEPSLKHEERGREIEEEFYREINIISFRRSLSSLTHHYTVPSAR